MGKCNSYHQGACMGTKECDACSCDGDESRCDFYPEKRAKAAMDKPLKDWTLGEVMEMCKNMICNECVFSDNDLRCELTSRDVPEDWNLSEPPRWTDQEREDAKTILRMFEGDYTTVERRYNEILLSTEKQNGWCAIVLSSKMFPSIKDGETVKLSEIAGEST